MHLRILALALALGGAGLLGVAAVRATAASSERSVDLARLAGRWYLIGRLPGMDGKHGLGAQVEYRLDGDKLEQSYVAHSGSLGGPLEKEQVRLAPDGSQPGHWKVNEGWFGSQQRLLLYVSPAYRRAIVADPAHQSAWLLAREAEIPEWSFSGLLARLAAQGYDVARLRRVLQKPEQVGMPGFE